MAHISEFKVGDDVKFEHKGAHIEGTIEKINAKTVKVTATNDVSWKVAAAFGKPARTKYSRPGMQWTMHIARDGAVSFRHVDEELASVSSGNDRQELVRAIHVALKGGMTREQVLMLCAAECVGS